MQQFDRRDIAMNKIVAACLEGHVHVWDARTHHPTLGFAGLDHKCEPSCTLFACAHMPQNR